MSWRGYDVRQYPIVYSVGYELPKALGSVTITIIIIIIAAMNINWEDHFKEQFSNTFHKFLILL